MKLTDFKGLGQKVDLKLLDKNALGNDIYEFNFSIENVKQWRPGEHAAFMFPDKKISGKTFRGFSIASIPDEGILKIATNISTSPSSFKKHLQSLTEGDTIRMRGPFGWFTLKDENSPLVMIAGGVGITPIRALFKELEKGNNHFVSLLYSSSQEHVFKDELLEIAEKDPRIDMYLIHNKEEVHRILNKKIMAYGNTAYYYISGSFSMIQDIRKKLRSKGISYRKIIIDPFL
jgi:NAD(P)H-flavin reductase